ncbi:unnamed protein product [Cuscuta campestris]|uniref:Uncharacterized protein n=1 Tax=Cuscuta campestris TaxID=132261 RepID=A0A484MP79_9ASTE|nr:unnamed protein product [Cuscuta campestris]
MTLVAVVAPLSASKATTLPGGGTITIVAAKKVSPAAGVAAVRRVAPAGPAVLSACVATAAMPRQQRRATVAAQGGPLSVKEEEGRPDLKKTRHGILKLKERGLSLEILGEAA